MKTLEIGVELILNRPWAHAIKYYTNQKNAYFPGGPKPPADLDRGVQIRGGSKSDVTPVIL